MLSLIKNFFSTTDAPANERSTLARKNVLYSFFIKGVSVLISLLLIPLTINYVNPTQYGVWLTLSSIITWLSFFDAGLGNGLRNKLAESNALNDTDKSKIYVSTTYFLLTIICLVFFLGFTIANQFINWTKLLNVSGVAEQYLKQVASIIMICFCIQFVAQLINIVLTACHNLKVVSVNTLLTQIVTLAIIYALKKSTTGSLLYLVVTLAGVPVLMLIILSVILYQRQYKSFSPSISFIKLRYSKELLALGGLFFLIQIGQLILYQTDNIVISQLFGPLNVTTFNVAYKLFSVVLVIFSLVINPYWSAFTDAYTKNDWIWISNTFNRLKKMWLYSSIGVIILIFASPLLYYIWLKKTVEIPFKLSATLGIYVICSTWFMLCCFFLNGINKIKLQLYLYMFCLVINIPLAVFLGHRIGIIGVSLSNIIVLVIMGSMLYIQSNKIINNTAKGLWNK